MTDGERRLLQLACILDDVPDTPKYLFAKIRNWFNDSAHERKIRNTPEAWRQLGLIPNSIKCMILLDCKKKDIAVGRVRDYHFALNYILDEMKEYQNLEHDMKLKCPFEWKERRKITRLLIIVIAVTCQQLNVWILQSEDTVDRLALESAVPFLVVKSR
eukprot:15366361-Ditylum_brightwellii.AAC.1